MINLNKIKKILLHVDKKQWNMLKNVFKSLNKTLKQNCKKNWKLLNCK